MFGRRKRREFPHRLVSNQTLSIEDGVVMPALSGVDPTVLRTVALAMQHGAASLEQLADEQDAGVVSMDETATSIFDDIEPV